MDTDMKTERNGYILMLDILGFKDSVSKEHGIRFIEIWESIQKQLKEARDACEKEYCDAEIQISLDFLCLSDTLIIGISITPDDEGLAFLPIVVLNDILDKLFLSCIENHHIFFRGALSYGRYIFDDQHNLVMGQALEEAAEWYEKTEWCGINLTPSAEYYIEYIKSQPIQKIRPNAKTMVEACVFKYDIPFKEGVDPACHYVFLWFSPALGGGRDADIWNSFLKTMSSIKHTPKYAMKYSNTVKFVEFCLFKREPIEFKDNS